MNPAALFLLVFASGLMVGAWIAPTSAPLAFLATASLSLSLLIEYIHRLRRRRHRASANHHKGN